MLPVCCAAFRLSKGRGVDRVGTRCLLHPASTITMSKRRNDGDEVPAKLARSAADHGGDSSRTSVLKAYIVGLNAQFASWVASQNTTNAGELWFEGVKDYIKFAEGLLDEFRDVVPGASAKPITSSAAPKVTFGVPAPAAEPETAPAPASGLFGFQGATASGFGSKPSTGFGSGSTSFGAPADKPDPNNNVGKAQATPAAKPALFSFSASASSSAADKDSAAPAFGQAPTNPAAANSTPLVEPAAAAATGPAASKAFTFGAAAAEGGDAGKQTPSDAAAAGANKPAPAFSFGGANASTASTAEAAPATNKPFAFGSGTTPAFGASATPAFGSGAPPAFGAGASASTPAFGSGAAASSAAAATSIFGVPKPAGEGASLFGAGATTAGGASTSAPAAFKFNDPSSAPSSSTPLFNFNPAAAAGSAPAANSGAAGTGEDGEEEEPAKFESAVTVNEESGAIIFKAKSKFNHMVKDPKDNKVTWESKGVGTFMLRTRPDETKKPFVTFTTEAGRVLYIANIPKTMQLILVDAKNAVTFSAPWSPDGQAPPTPQGVMFCFPKGQHKVFKEELDKLQAAMS